MTVIDNGTPGTGKEILSGINLTSPSPRGNRGTYTYRLSPGDHVIEWTVFKAHGGQKTYSRQFYVDSYGRSINIVIDGDEFYRN